MNRIIKALLFPCVATAFLGGALLSSCQDEIDKSAIYTFTGQTVADILKDDPELSDYYELTQMVMPTGISDSPVSQLISARGHYSCFAPTNEAIKEYLNELFTKGIIGQKADKAYEIENEHVRDSIMKTIVLNSIIDCGDNNEAYNTFDFVNDATLPITNMNDRLLRTNITSENGHTVYLVSRTCPVLQRDIEATNGYVQKMGMVVAPNNSNVFDLMSNTDNMTFFAHLLQKTGFQDTLQVVRDEVYEEAYRTNKIVHTLGTMPDAFDEAIIPEHRYIGFTIFAEPDEVYHQNNITSIETLIAYLVEHNCYPDSRYDRRTEKEGGNYKDPKHIVRQFVAYHILPQATPYDRLVIHRNERGYNQSLREITLPVFEYYTTMNEYPRRIIKITESKYTEGIRLNRYTEMIATAHEYDENVNENTIPGILVNPSNGEITNEAINGYVYPIDELLVYDEDIMTSKVLNERIRFDLGALLPEMMTNNMRGLKDKMQRSWYRGFDGKYPYFGDNLSWSENTSGQYSQGMRSNYRVYQADEYQFFGHYDVTVKLPPVPFDGTYELRYLTSSHPLRGMAQIYFGEKGHINATGIPLDLRLDGKKSYADPSLVSPIGWEPDSEDDQDYNDLVDKRMRNNGYMKAPNYWGFVGDTYNTCRKQSDFLRKILFAKDLERNKTYYIRFKSVLENEKLHLNFDCLELVPSNIYNNPEKKEDIW